MKKTKVLDALAVFLIAVVTILFLSTFLYSWFGRYATLISEILLIIPAYFFIIVRNEKITERFGFKLPEIKHFFAAAVMFVGVNMLQNAVTYALYPIYYKNVENSDISFLDSFSDVSPYLVLVVIAIVPAICEEILFRGYLISAFSEKGNKKSAVLGITVSAILFSILHFSIYKLPFTLIMGLAFGFIAYKTGSILLTAIFHFLSNANALLSYYSLKNMDSDEAITFIFKDLSMILIGLICLSISVLIITLAIRLFSNKKHRKAPVIIMLIVAVIISSTSFVTVVINELDTVLVSTITEQSYTEEFELDKNALCMVTPIVSSDVDLKIVDSEGETVYKYQADTAGIITLEKGKYTLMVECEEEFDAVTKYAVQILSIGEYETAKEPETEK